MKKTKTVVNTLTRMSTAVGLLIFLAVFSAVGTLVEQNLPEEMYEQAFGSFWAEVLGMLGVFSVFTAPWFLAVLGLLCASLVLCLWKQLKSKARLNRRRVGYFALHLGVLLFCGYGLLSIFFSYRGEIHLKEGGSASAVRCGGGKICSLPFALTNKGFEIEHYESGMPSEFITHLAVGLPSDASEVHTLKVNHPYIKNGVRVFQASFGDAGSPVTLDVFSQEGGELKGKVGTMFAHPSGAKVEITALNPHTVVPLPRGEGQQKFQDLGASVEYILTLPTRAPIKLRSYHLRENVLGVMLEDGTFEDVYLGLSPENQKGRELFFKFQGEALGSEPLKAFTAQAKPFLEKLPKEERLATAFQTLQALQVSAELELPLWLTLKDYEKHYYTTLQISYDPFGWLFYVASLLLLLGAVLLLYIRK